MSLQKEIKEDPRVRRALRRLKDTSLDIEALWNELMSMHATRDVRALTPKKVMGSSVSALVTAKLTDSGYRSRAVEIKVKVLSEVLERDSILKDLRKYILTAFHRRLKKSHSTLTAQKNYVDVLLESFTTKSTEMHNLMKLADLVIEDIDQAGWTLKLVQETLATLQKERYE